MGSIDIPPFLRDKAKQQVQKKNGQSESMAVPDFIKKKDSETVSEDIGTPSQTGTENIPPSPSISTSEVKESRFKDNSIFTKPYGETIFEKSFLDRDIESRNDLDLSNPALTKPTNKYSLRNLYTDAAQKRYEEEKENEKRLIKQSPESLAAYNKDRIDKINADIAENTQKLQDQFVVTPTSPEFPQSLKDREVFSANIAEAQAYKNKLKNSVALQAAKTIIPASVAPGIPFDPRKIGRDIIKVADPEQDLMMQEAESGGATLPGITKSYLEKVGIDLSMDYLNSLPQNPEVEQQKKIVDDYSKDFDERNFELTAQRAREKLSVYFYDKGKSGFWGYSGKNIEKAINDPESGLTESEKKVALDYVLPIEKRLFFSTDIGGSGFFRSFKNAIDKSLVNTGNTVSGWVGDRNDSNRAFDILNEEVDGSRFRSPGDNPTWKSELSNLTKKEAKEKLTPEEQTRKVELEKYVDVRNGWSKFKDGTGDLTGQVAEIALLTKGVGVAGRALTAIGEGGGILTGGLTSSAFGSVLANETVGLFLSSYLNSYDGYRQQALQTMPGKENAANRDAYAKVMAGVEGLSERIFRDTKILNSFTKNVSPTIADITNRFINKEITQQLAKEELQKTLVQKLKPFAKEFGTSLLQESTEEAVVDFAEGAASSIFGGQPFDLIGTGQKAVNTFLTTALYSGVVGGMAAHGAVRQNNSQNAFMKSAIADMANRPTPYLQSVEELRMSGQITQPEANEKIKLINSASNYLKEIPETITVSKKTDGVTETTERQLDYPEVSTYLIHRLNEGIINDKLETTTDEVLKGQLEQQLKRSIEIRKGIVDGTIGVTPNLEEVAADEKKANDLNVLNAETLPEDELIGTPFTNIKTKTDEKNNGKESNSQETGQSSQESSESGGESQALTAKPEGAAGNVVPSTLEKPSMEQQLKDVQDGNVVSFNYKNENEVPEVFKDKISSSGEVNGENYVRVSVAKSLADYELAKQQSTPTEGNVVPSTLKDVESFETSKGSVYTVGEDGKTSRFKTKTSEQNDPQDLTVFAKLDGQESDDYLQALHGTNGESVHVAGIIDGKVQTIETNADAAKAENIKLIIADKDGKIIQKIDKVTTTPIIGYSVYDQRNLGENKFQKHIGNEVSKINPKQQSTPTGESQSPTEKPKVRVTAEQVQAAQPKAEDTKPEPKQKASDRLRSISKTIREKGIHEALPNWAKVDLPEGTQQAGFGGKYLDEAVAKAIEIVADAIDAGSKVSDAIKVGFEDLKKYYEENTKSFDEKKVKQEFESFFNDLKEEEKEENKSKKQKVEEKINDIGSNVEDVLLYSVQHRKDVGSDVSVEDTAKSDKLRLLLVQEDANGFIEEMKEEYGKNYLTKSLTAISSINKNKVNLDNILAVGIALENEINNIKDGFTENDFNISRPELNKVYAKIQKINVENARTSSKALNTAKTLYNNYENTIAKENILTPDQSAQKSDIMETVLNEDKISEAADAHESGVKLTEEENAEVEKKDARKPKVVTEKNKVKAKITDIVTDLKNTLKKLDC